MSYTVPHPLRGPVIDDVRKYLIKYNLSGLETSIFFSLIKQADTWLLKVKLSPDSWVAYESLADAYLKNKQDEPALINYQKSVALNPDNLDGKQQIERLKKRIKN